MPSLQGLPLVVVARLEQVARSRLEKDGMVKAPLKHVA